MIAFAWILLLVAPTSVELVDEVYQIPASEWRYVELSLKQQPALISATFHVLSGSEQARIALMRGQDLERLRGGLPHGIMAVTPLASSGNLSYYVRRPDDYAMVVDNRAGQPAAVHLRIRLEFGGREAPAVTRLSAGRQLAVIVISFAVFFGIVSYSARRVWRAIQGPPVDGD
ncbi:MAG: hypothetical protein ABSH44_25170 [Bryobacteraceae bacterium]|jgi:hypothetical protein